MQKQFKCKIMHLGHSSDRAEYTMNDNGIEISLEVISEEKDLGVWMDDRVKFSTHIGHAVATGNQVLGLIKRSNCSPGLRYFKATVLVRHHLEYVNVVCHPRFKKDIGELERAQRRATKLVNGFSSML